MTTTENTAAAPAARPPFQSFTSVIGSAIFVSRWLQAPLYLGLIVAQVVYVIVFWKELIHLAKDFNHLNEAAVMLIVLGLVDVVMIANLLIMVIIGGYETFVSRIRMDSHPDKPEWLSHVNPNVLKVKLAMSIIGISSIHLLKSFINADNLEPETLKWQTIIHMAFIASAIGLAYVDWISAKVAAINRADAH
ncbi:TIGR00645 family protein [Mycobacterium sp. AMU20-3851]|uniref:TIGR00645 family protein n=1 Tax=Mycobacterium sp. AMU20-3851 TaxID=3122055 RepID=UPI0037540336